MNEGLPDQLIYNVGRVTYSFPSDRQAPGRVMVSPLPTLPLGPCERMSAHVPGRCQDADHYISFIQQRWLYYMHETRTCVDLCQKSCSPHVSGLDYILCVSREGVGNMGITDLDGWRNCGCEQYTGTLIWSPPNTCR